MRKRIVATRRRRTYGTRLRSEHRVVPVGHGMRPTYGARTRRMITRLFR